MPGELNAQERAGIWILKVCVGKVWLVWDELRCKARDVSPRFSPFFPGFCLRRSDYAGPTGQIVLIMTGLATTTISDDLCGTDPAANNVSDPAV